MVRPKLRGWLTGLLAAGLAVSSVAADQTRSSASADDKVSRLEALLEAQQKKLDALEAQLTAASEKDAEAARVEAMRAQIREILSEQEFRESLMPSITTAGYDKGFYIRSTDEKFLAKLNGYLQFRWTHYGNQSRNRYLLPRLERNDRTGFDVQRLRFHLSGHIYNEDITYNLQVRADAPDTWDFVLHRMWVNFRFHDELQLKAGVFQTAMMRSQLLADEYGQQFVDRSMVDAVFGLGNGLGVRLWGQLFDKKLEYFVDVVNSLNGVANRTITPDPAEHDNNPAILARLVWHALGDDLKTWSTEGDVEHHDSPQLDFGFSYAFNEDDGDQATTRIPFPWTRRVGNAIGGYGLTSTNGLQINQFGWDTAFKYMGFSATGEYVIRLVDPTQVASRPFTPWYLLTGQEDTTVQHGAYVQVGYFLPIPGLEKKIEAVARVGGISALANGQEGSWEYAGGLNYYIDGHNIKLQTDVTKIYEVPITSSYSSLANVNDNALIWRVQLQVAF
ncbi:MAG: hypothetical protein HRF50_14655 [Phycisphaerae bacterium]|jgi:hypothetical protein